MLAPGGAKPRTIVVATTRVYRATPRMSAWPLSRRRERRLSDHAAHVGVASEPASRATLQRRFGGPLFGLARCAGLVFGQVSVPACAAWAAALTVLRSFFGVSSA